MDVAAPLVGEVPPALDIDGGNPDGVTAKDAADSSEDGGGSLRPEDADTKRDEAAVEDQGGEAEEDVKAAGSDSAVVEAEGDEAGVDAAVAEAAAGEGDKAGSDAVVAEAEGDEAGVDAVVAEAAAGEGEDAGGRLPSVLVDGLGTVDVADNDDDDDDDDDASVSAEEADRLMQEAQESMASGDRSKKGRRAIRKAVRYLRKVPKDQLSEAQRLFLDSRDSFVNLEQAAKKAQEQRRRHEEAL